MALGWCSSTSGTVISYQHGGMSAWLTLTAIRNLFHVSLLASRPGRLNSILFLSTGYPGHTVTASPTSQAPQQPSCIPPCRVQFLTAGHFCRRQPRSCPAPLTVLPDPSQLKVQSAPTPHIAVSWPRAYL